jgi:dipeptidyl aminopeptidase/acylaminoacyl peptidase
MPRLLFATPDRAAWRDRSPRTAAQPTVPTLLLHGTHDGLVPVDQARRLAAHRESLGLPTRLVIVPDAPHGFFTTPTPFAASGVRELIDYVAI